MSGARDRRLYGSPWYPCIPYLAQDSIALENCYGLKSLKCRLQFKNKFIVLFIIIFGTLSFPIPELNSTARTAERWALYKQVR